jgi:DNA-binding CsgD family transcriptional regulator
MRYTTSQTFAGQELLTPRERMVLAQIVRGASSREAARSLDVSPRTIEFHRANIMLKLGRKMPPTWCGSCLGVSNHPERATDASFAIWLPCSKKCIPNLVETPARKPSRRITLRPRYDGAVQ